MPTAVFEFYKSSHSINGLRRNCRWRSNSRAGGCTRQLRVFVIKKLSMVVVPCGVDGKAMGTMGKMRSDTAGP